MKGSLKLVSLLAVVLMSLSACDSRGVNVNGSVNVKPLPSPGAANDGEGDGPSAPPAATVPAPPAAPTVVPSATVPAPPTVAPPAAPTVVPPAATVPVAPPAAGCAPITGQTVTLNSLTNVWRLPSATDNMNRVDDLQRVGAGSKFVVVSGPYEGPIRKVGGKWLIGTWWEVRWDDNATPVGYVWQGRINSCKE
jgi:hypothetical protein